MPRLNERRALQAAVFIAALVPLTAGLTGMVQGTSMLADMADISLDSHVRYLSGLLFGIGLAFWSLIPYIETQGAKARLLTLIVFIGGLARLYGLAAMGMPSGGMLFGLGMELVVTPLLCLWQFRISKSLQSPRSLAR